MNYCLGGSEGMEYMNEKLICQSKMIRSPPNRPPCVSVECDDKEERQMQRDRLEMKDTLSAKSLY